MNFRFLSVLNHSFSRFSSSTSLSRQISTETVKKAKVPRSISKISLSSSDLQEKAANYLGSTVKETKIKTCSSVSTCERYDLQKAMSIFHANGVLTAQELLPGDIVSVKYPLKVSKNVVDVVVLNNGSVVAWGMTEKQVLELIIPLLKPAECLPYKHIETEEMDYVESKKSSTGNGESADPPSALIGDLLIISGKKRALDKVAFSSGLSRSTKLAALEQSLEKYILTIKGDSDRLASGKMIRLDDRGVLKATGQLLQIRGQLNLYTDLIETPDIYWSEPELEHLYSMISRQLDIGHRISIMNKKLDYASEFVGVIKSYTSERSATRLEWMIIILITVEVVFETFHTVDRLKEKGNI